MVQQREFGIFIKFIDTLNIDCLKIELKISMQYLVHHLIEYFKAFKCILMEKHTDI